MLATTLLLLLAGQGGATTPTQPDSAKDREQVLLTIISEPEDNLVHQVVMVIAPDRTLRHIVRRSKEDETIATAQQLREGEVVMARTDGRASVTLSCPKCDETNSGITRLRYISNGVFRRWGTMAMKIDRTEDGSFRLWSLQGERIEKLRLTSRRWLGVLIGVKSVEIDR